MKQLFSITLLLLSNIAHAQGVVIKDSQGEHHFQQTPPRVIALSWAMAENLIELGVTPVAVADIKGYQTWVRIPPLPDSVTDVGTRAAPSLERIAQLAPDLILIGEQQQALLSKLRPIAPVLFFNAFSKDHNNYQKGHDIFIQLAKLFDKQSQAEQKLTTKDQRLYELRKQLNDHFNHAPPNVSAIHFTSPALIRLFGENSMPQYALEALGISPALPQPNSQWGLTQKRVIDLAQVDDGVVLYFQPFDKKEQLFNTPLWKAMPFVRNNRFGSVEPTWTYGGVMSVLYLAEAMSSELLQIQP